MAQDVSLFEQFLLDVPPNWHPFVYRINALLDETGHDFALTSAVSGPVASYRDPKSKHVVINYVFRRKKLHVRIYADHVCQDATLLAEMPEDMAEKMRKSPVCRRLLDPTKCNPRCRMGYTFVLRDELIKKCRYSCFLLEVTESREPYLLALIQSEVHGRAADAAKQL